MMDCNHAGSREIAGVLSEKCLYFYAMQFIRGRSLDAILHEARRLNLRIAELTDLVTELVLPLHDREIDPALLDRLRPDTF